MKREYSIIIIVFSILLIVDLLFFLNYHGGFHSIRDMELGKYQLRKEINELFSENNKISIYPSTRFIKIKQGDTDGFGIGIKNLLTGTSGDKKFSYSVNISYADLKTKCNISEEVAERLIVTGKSEEKIPIPSGDISINKVLFQIPLGAPLCTIRFRINVNAEGDAYATDFVDIKIISQ